LLNKAEKVQVSDTTMFNSSTYACTKIKLQITDFKLEIRAFAYLNIRTPAHFRIAHQRRIFAA